MLKSHHVRKYKRSNLEIHSNLFARKKGKGGGEREREERIVVFRVREEADVTPRVRNLFQIQVE